MIVSRDIFKFFVYLFVVASSSSLALNEKEVNEQKTKQLHRLQSHNSKISNSNDFTATAVVENISDADRKKWKKTSLFSTSLMQPKFADDFLAFANLTKEKDTVKTTQQKAIKERKSNLHMKSNFDDRITALEKWKNHRSNRADGNKIEKETRIAEIFMGVAYGRMTATSTTEREKNDENKLKAIFVNNYYNDRRSEPVKGIKGEFQQTERKDINSGKYFFENYTKTSEPSQIVSVPRRVQKSVKKYKAKSLVQEDTQDALKNIDFSLPQLFLSAEEKSSELEFYYHKTASAPTHKPSQKISFSNSYKSSSTEENLAGSHGYSEVDTEFKDNFKYRNQSVYFNNHDDGIITNKIENETNIVSVKSPSSFYMDQMYLNWTYIYARHSSNWHYQDYFVLIFFCAISFLPLFVIFHLQIMKRNHVTPKYCLLLMMQLLIVCWSRIILYSVDPFGLNGRFSQYVISELHIVAQSLLICSVGLFLVILVFPVYRPQSYIFSRVACLFLLLLFLTKTIAFAVYIFLGDFRRLKKVQMCITAVDFSEIGSLTIAYIFLKFCTKQRHKIWWIRLYRKSLNTVSSSSANTNGNFSVLYLFLKRSIWLGTGASFILLFNILWTVNASFNLNIVFGSLYSKPLLCWLLETTKRLLEGVACCFLIFGSCYFFEPKERLIIRKRSTFKTLSDMIKGRRRSGSSQSSVTGKMMQPLNIFTLNRNRKATDYATTDFQLVWNQNQRTLRGTNSDRRKSAKSLYLPNDNHEGSTLAVYAKDLKQSHSLDILNSVYESKCPANSFSIYDNLEYDKNRTPIYQNQYFHYNYQPQLHDVGSSATVHNVYRTNPNATSQIHRRKDNNKKQRPKSCHVEEKPKINENYLTSYFSVLSIDKQLENKNNWTKSYSGAANLNNGRISDAALRGSCTLTADPSEAKVLLSEELNSPMVSSEKWKDIRITPKSCTIKINSKKVKKKLSSSKSVDFF